MGGMCWIQRFTHAWPRRTSIILACCCCQQHTRTLSVHAFIHVQVAQQLEAYCVENKVFPVFIEAWMATTLDAANANTGRTVCGQG